MVGRMSRAAPRHAPPVSPSPARHLTVIRFENVTKTYAGQSRAALDDVSVEIEKGEFVFLVGASGPASRPSCA